MEIRILKKEYYNGKKVYTPVRKNIFGKYVAIWGTAHGDAEFDSKEEAQNHVNNKLGYKSSIC